MEPYRYTIILGCIGVYMLLCVGVGIWALRRTKSAKDFFVAGRRLGILVTSIAIFSSLISGFTFVGGPGLVYRMGMSSMWMLYAGIIGGCLSAVLVGKRLRLFAELRETLSLPDAVAARYNSETTRFLTAVAILLGVVGYLAVQILAMSLVLQSLLQRSELVAAVPLEICVLAACAVLVFYCTTGGIIASVYTDLVQGLVMVVAAALVYFTARASLGGGFTAMTDAIMSDDRETMGPWGSASMLCGLSWLFLFMVGACGQPHVITKHMMFRRVGDLKWIIPISIVAGMITVLLTVPIGMLMRALVLTGAQPELASPDAAAPVFLQAFANPVLAGVVLAGLFAAIMSSADSFLNIGAAALVHDIPRAFGAGKAATKLRNARLATVAIAITAALVGLYWGDLVALLGAFGWGTFAAALVPVVAIGFNWKRATAAAANTAIIFSLVVNFGIKLFSIELPGGIDGGALALTGSLALFFVVSMLSKPRPLDADIDAVMDL
ncbi:MAG: hypothetical protein IID28_02220 [Planctomycetes bacterium]|nr:hypothetical protein [Planctomycetota bacterium]